MVLFLFPVLFPVFPPSICFDNGTDSLGDWPGGARLASFVHALET